MRIRVGVDVGTHSVGCCAIAVDPAGAPVRILSALSLIHDAGIGEDGKEKATSRRELAGVARRARRLLRRRRKRLQQLDTLLVRLGYPIVDFAEQKDPYLVWRVRAQLVQEVFPEKTRRYAISMALRHIARHRGWRNPYARTESLLAPAPESDFMRAMRKRVMNTTGEVLDEGFTPGQAMAVVALNNRVAMRGPDGVLGKLHQTDNANEIRRICKTQGVSEQECRELILAVFASESPRGSSRSRVASDPLPGQGDFLRAPKCDPEFQRFRVISIVANLRIAGRDGAQRPLLPRERKKVVTFLLESMSEDLAWGDVAERLGVRRQNLRGTASMTADGERASAQPPVDVTNQVMGSCRIKPLRLWWADADAERRGAMVRYLYEGADDSECAEFLGSLSEEEQGKLDSIHLPAGRAAYSRESLALLSEQMLATDDDLHAARKHVFHVDDSWKPPAEPVGAPVGNPSVDRTVKAVARFLNGVADVWGTPEAIQIEHVRAGFSSERTARELDHDNNRRFRQNQTAVDDIKKAYGIQGEVRHSDVVRYTEGYSGIVRVCWWDSWDDPGRGRVQICHKGALGRDQPREEARNINDSLRALRPDPGLCGRFGQLGAVAGPGRGRHGPTGDHDGHSGERTGPTGRVAGLPGRRPAPRRALRTRKCSSNRHFRVQNAPLDEEGADGDLADRGDDRPETSPATR